MIKYVHLRYNEEVILNNGIFEYYSVRRSPKGGVTLAVEQQPDESFRIGVAICSQKDSYCRQVGRDLATMSLFLNKGVFTLSANASQKPLQRAMARLRNDLERAVYPYGLDAQKVKLLKNEFTKQFYKYEIVTV